MDHLLPIGEFARRSGLSVSALRFYAREDVLRPAAVDDATGYRRYAPEQVRGARLIAGLRRIGLPLAEIREAAEHEGDHELIAGLLDAHAERLERGLADARREIERLRTTLTPPRWPVDVRLAAGDLARLLDAVRFAVGCDPELPVLNGALMEISLDTLRLVATDRFRLAVHEVPARASGPGAALVPADGLTAMAEMVGVPTLAESPVELRFDRSDLVLTVGGRTLATALADGEFPDYRRLLTDGPVEGLPWQDDLVEVDAPEPGLSTLLPTSAAEAVVVRHEYLMEAVAAAGSSATLSLDGPITPLAIRADDGALSLLMPARPESA